MLALGVIAIASGCDPCRDLGDRYCDCLYEDEARIRQCKEELNVAPHHKFFALARKQEICKEALKKCHCKQILAGKDERCGRYRPAFLD